MLKARFQPDDSTANLIPTGAAPLPEDLEASAINTTKVTTPTLLSFHLSILSRIIDALKSPRSMTVIEALAQAFTGLLVAVRLTGTSYLLSQLGFAAAGPIIAGVEGLTAGVIFALGALGLLFTIGPYFEKKETDTEATITERLKIAGNIVKAALIITGIPSAFLVILYVSIEPILKSIFPLEPEAATEAGQFFLGYAPGIGPELIVTVIFCIFFQAREFYIPLLLSLLNTFDTLLFSYYLGFNANLGSFGVGLGNSIAFIITASFTFLYLFLRKTYIPLQLLSGWKGTHIKLFNPLTWVNPDITNHFSELLKKGGVTALQNATEWLNLFLIAVVVGIFGSANVLAAIQPTMQWLTLFGFLIQNFGTAIGSLISRDPTNRDTNNLRSLLTNNTVNMTMAIVISIIFYFYREPFSNLFLSPNTDQATQELSQLILIAGIVGLIPDSSRNVASGTLRGLGKFLSPILISFLLMSIVGIPVGYGATVATDQNWAWLFGVRDISLLVTAVILNTLACKKLRSPETVPTVELTELQDLSGSFNTLPNSSSELLSAAPSPRSPPAETLTPC